MKFELIKKIGEKLQNSEKKFKKVWENFQEILHPIWGKQQKICKNFKINFVNV